MSQTFNIGSDDLVRHTNRLERMHRSDLPIVVRQTLNDAAFAAKKETLPRVFRQEFIQRNKSFIRAKSRVDAAKGWDVTGMVSSFGIIDDGTQATEDMAIQEKGGVIKGRSLVPMKGARVGGSLAKNVKKKARLSEVGRVRTANDGGELIKIAYQQKAKGQVIYDNVLWDIKRITKNSKGGSFVVMAPLYSYKEGRVVTVKKNPFMTKTANIQGRKLGEYFVKNAEKRFTK